MKLAGLNAQIKHTFDKHEELDVSEKRLTEVPKLRQYADHFFISTYDSDTIYKIYGSNLGKMVNAAYKNFVGETSTKTDDDEQFC